MWWQKGNDKRLTNYSSFHHLPSLHFSEPQNKQTRLLNEVSFTLSWLSLTYSRTTPKGNMMTKRPLMTKDSLINSPFHHLPSLSLRILSFKWGITPAFTPAITQSFMTLSLNYYCTIHKENVMTKRHLMTKDSLITHLSIISLLTSLRTPEQTNKTLEWSTLWKKLI